RTDPSSSDFAGQALLEKTRPTPAKGVNLANEFFASMHLAAFVGPFEDGSFEIEDVPDSLLRDQVGQTRGAEAHRAIENGPAWFPRQHLLGDLVDGLEVHRR
ncbi:MAG: hypothetical protein QM784_25435, partial [Polyangiaceae bacterium]